MWCPILNMRYCKSGQSLCKLRTQKYFNLGDGRASLPLPAGEVLTNVHSSSPQHSVSIRPTLSPHLESVLAK